MSSHSSLREMGMMLLGTCWNVLRSQPKSLYAGIARTGLLSQMAVRLSLVIRICSISLAASGFLAPRKMWLWKLYGPATTRASFLPTGPVGCGIRTVSSTISRFVENAVATIVPPLLLKPIVPARYASLFDGSVQGLIPGGMASCHFGLVYTSLSHS